MEGATVIVQLIVAVFPVESVTVAPNVNVPAFVGRPVTAPVEALSDRPPGSAPLLMLNVYGVTPPAAVSADE